jgi:hypothetical protein
MAMTPRRLRLDATSLWFEAPFVIALRLQQMQMAALTGRTQDVVELNRMISEKVAATAESVVAVNIAIGRMGLASTLRAMTGGRASSAWNSETLLAAALKPYGKRVRSNARRLSRTTG